MRKLSNDGFVPRTKANDAERTASDAQAGIASLQSDIAATVTSLAATELQLSQTRSTYMKQVDTELADAQKQKDTLKSRVISLQFDKSLAQVRAPTEGIVVGSKANTVGGVIAAGQVIMEIVPREERLVVEARIPPHLIDKVAVGLDADIRFDAFNTYTTPVIPGVVRLVGADLMPPLPPQTSSEYFLAQIEVTQDGMKLLKEKKIRAGMPATVIVKNGERPFLSYLLKPLADRFATSFKEHE
jgi:protease secretion system membrane fusion protein